MEFSGFLPEALDFLVENRLNNDKGFYDNNNTIIFNLINDKLIMQNSLIKVEPDQKMNYHSKLISTN